MTGSTRSPKSAKFAGEDPATAEFKPPLRPHPILALVLGIALVIWLGILVWMRMKTIKPAPGPPPETIVHQTQ